MGVIIKTSQPAPLKPTHRTVLCKHRDDRYLDTFASSSVRLNTSGCVMMTVSGVSEPSQWLGGRNSRASHSASLERAINTVETPRPKHAAEADCFGTTQFPHPSHPLDQLAVAGESRSPRSLQFVDIQTLDSHIVHCSLPCRDARVAVNQ
jgi:hypothetical protein